MSAQVTGMSPGIGGRKLIKAFFPSADSISVITWRSSIVSFSPRLKISKGAPRYCDRSQHALNDVFYIGKVSPRSTVAVDIDWFAVVN